MRRFSKKLGIEKLAEFDDHKLVSFVYDKTTGLKGFIAIHRGNTNHPAFGATRLWKYESDLGALKDALRLSKTMSYKAALAGLPYGGGKGVLMADSIKPRRRKEALRIYAEQVNCLGGHFITGADVGISQADVQIMRERSPYFVGLKGDPVKLTALGVFYAIEVCLEKVFSDAQIKGRSFAIQGLGKVGTGLLELLYAKGGQIFAADTDREKVRQTRKKFPEVTIIKPKEIYQQPVDVFSPCALSGVINRRSISKLHCAIVAGGANNQLENDQAGELLYERGILYVPDYVVNAGGLISVIDEFENSGINKRRIEQRVAGIKETLQTILRRSKKEKKPTNVIADQMAEKILRGL